MLNPLKRNCRVAPSPITVFVRVMAQRSRHNLKSLQVDTNMAEAHAASRPPHSGLPVFSIADCRCSATKCSGNIRPALQVGVPVDGLQPPLQAVLHTAYASRGSADGAAPQGGDEGRLSPGGGPPRSPLRQTRSAQVGKSLQPSTQHFSPLETPVARTWDVNDRQH